jgi:hypothetical protein
MVLTFNQKSVEQAELDYKKIDLSPKRRETINMVASMYKDSLGISLIAIKGFISFAIQDWQLESHIKLEDLDGLAPDERMKQNKRIGEIFYAKLSLIIPKEQEPVLQKIFHEASLKAQERTVGSK